MNKTIAFLAGLLASASVFAANPVVELTTNQGKMTIELYADKAPKTVENFLQYVKDDFYRGTVFHRVIKGFMIQGGGFTADMAQKRTRAPIANESKNGVKNARGTIAMARTPNPDSATSQFFINHGDNANLDYPSFDGYGYAAFGKVTQGLDIVDKIADAPTGMHPSGHRDVPREPIVIQSITLVQPK
jgi:peptidyl-prolyl cis-trans isomerase A (cyclophilin A)